MRNEDDVLKNMVDVLNSAKNLKQLEEMLRKKFNICRQKNMRIKASKCKIPQRVKFGGCIIESNTAKGSVEISPDPKKVDELLCKDPPKGKKEVQSIIGSINQLSAWNPHLKLKIPIMRKMTGSMTLFKESPELEREFNFMKK